MKFRHRILKETYNNGESSYIIQYKCSGWLSKYFDTWDDNIPFYHFKTKEAAQKEIDEIEGRQIKSKEILLTEK